MPPGQGRTPEGRARTGDAGLVEARTESQDQESQGDLGLDGAGWLAKGTESILNQFSPCRVCVCVNVRISKLTNGRKQLQEALGAFG